MENIQELCSLFLPKDTLKHFDITNITTDENEINITLTEKNNPPKHTGKLKTKGFKTIIVSDFPIRSKRAVLTYHRRYWQVDGQKELITSDIPLVHTGTKLERDFAEVLKKRGGDDPDFLGEYRDFIPTPTQGV